MTTLTRRYRFSASHQLRAAAYSEERNREVFGKCSNAFGHGHNYYLEVSVQGDPDPTTGMILPREVLDRWVADTVLDRIEHTHLNTGVPEFRAVVPTSENLLLVVKNMVTRNMARALRGPDSSARRPTPRGDAAQQLPGCRPEDHPTPQ